MSRTVTVLWKILSRRCLCAGTGNQFHVLRAGPRADPGRPLDIANFGGQKYCLFINSLPHWLSLHNDILLGILVSAVDAHRSISRILLTFSKRFYPVEDKTIEAAHH